MVINAFERSIIMPKIYFSLRQANELVKRIRKDVELLSDLNEQLSMLDNTKIEFDDDSLENFLLEVELNRHFHEKNVEMYSLLGSLIRQGCVVRDLEKMEIDFYSKHSEKEIVLCWRPSEEHVMFWHYPKEGLEKRRSVKELEDAYLAKLDRMK
ncbi:Uncharacterised protein [uncultured archaeon]|nr:Uncharacterised protein [uncultured archaeon]